jgi:hypothetical protein
VKGGPSELAKASIIYSVSVGKLGAVSNLDMGCSQDNTERFPNAVASLTILLVGGGRGMLSVFKGKIT